MGSVDLIDHLKEELYLRTIMICIGYRIIGAIPSHVVFYVLIQSTLEQYPDPGVFVVDIAVSLIRSYALRASD